jgi:hypothetical protein
MLVRLRNGRASWGDGRSHTWPRADFGRRIEHDNHVAGPAAVSSLGNMRRFALLLVLAACGKSSDPPKSTAVEDDPEERCDPKETRVCVGSRVVACEEGKLGRALRQCGDTCRKGKCVGSCADGAELIYVVDANDQLLSFDPRKLPRDPFKLIGVMNCGALGSPFSMSVDRSGTAWVLYSDGSVFEVQTTDASCRPSGFTSGGTFGMGFTAEAPGSKAEKLYLAANDGSHQLSYLDTTKDIPTQHAVARLPATRHPELTGTSEGKLYGFFPETFQQAFVQEIDRKDGSLVGTKWELADRFESISAYAFAHWGGTFYIFVTDDRSTVRTVNRATGAYEVVMPNIPFRITGAGVSTCAPERDQGKP